MSESPDPVSKSAHTTPKLQRVRSAQTLTDQAQQSLRHAIMTGQLRPGEMHSVAELAAQLGVSRTPVREAVLELARIGMVEIRRNQGVRILARSASDVAHIYQLRIWLEVPAAEYAATHVSDTERAQIAKAHAHMLEAGEAGDQAQVEKFDAQFHALILRVTTNPRLTAFLDELRDLLLSRNQTTIGKSQSLLEVVHDHDGVLDAILTGDGPRAASEMLNHLETTRDGVIALIENE